MTKRGIWGLVLLLIAVGVGLSVAAARSNSSEDPELPTAAEPMPVSAVMVSEVGSFSRLRTYTGIVKGRRTSALSFQRSAKLLELFVDEGSHVEQGQPLARLDTRRLAAQLTELQAQRDQQAALLAELESGPRAQTIAAARAVVAGLESELARIQSDTQRSSRLLAENAVSIAVHEANEFQALSTQARLTAATERLNELEEGSRRERIAAQRARVAQLDASVARVEIEIDDSTLTAPFAGRVTARHFDEGVVVAPGSPVVTVVEQESLEAWIGIPVDSADAIRAGERLTASVGKMEVPATVKTVLPELDVATRTRSVVLSLDQVGSVSVVPGQIARVTLRDRVPMAGFWLPTTALSRGNRGLWSALVVESDESGSSIAARRDVEVLHTEGDRVLVRGTLDERDVVITSGVHRLAPGQPVEMTEVVASTPLGSAE